MEHIGITKLPTHHERGPAPGMAAFTTDSELAQRLWEMGLPTSILRERELAFIIKRTGVPLGIHDAVAAIADECILITTDMDDAGLWARAKAHKANFVVVLPDGERWLRDRIVAAS